jgi:hypothetical protein
MVTWGDDGTGYMRAVQRGDSVKSRAHVRQSIFQSLLYFTKYAYTLSRGKNLGVTSWPGSMFHDYPTVIGELGFNSKW